MTPDRIFDVLRNSTRRKTVAILVGTDGISRDRLTNILATAEAADDTERVRQRIRLNLHHNHLPRMAEAGLIEYDDETVTPTPRLETVAQSFPLVNEAQPSART